jgi:hypothetical protein
MPHDSAGNRILGYSRFDKTIEGKDQRFRVGVECARRGEVFEVAIIAAPPKPNKAPLCRRCGREIR